MLVKVRKMSGATIVPTMSSRTIMMYTPDLLIRSSAVSRKPRLADLPFSVLSLKV
jgi:hypothetical protein